jgi:K+ transporter
MEKTLEAIKKERTTLQQTVQNLRTNYSNDVSSTVSQLAAEKQRIPFTIVGEIREEKLHSSVLGHIVFGVDHKRSVTQQEVRGLESEDGKSVVFYFQFYGYRPKSIQFEITSECYIKILFIMGSPQKVLCLHINMC